MTSSRPTIWPSSSSHQSEFGAGRLILHRAGGGEYRRGPPHDDDGGGRRSAAATAIASRARLLRNAGLSVQPAKAARGDQTAVLLAPRAISGRGPPAAAKAAASSSNGEDLVRDRRLRRWLDIRIDGHAAQQVVGRAKRLLVLLPRRNGGLRTRLLGALCCQTAPPRR